MNPSVQIISISDNATIQLRMKLPFLQALEWIRHVPVLDRTIIGLLTYDFISKSHSNLNMVDVQCTYLDFLESGTYACHKSLPSTLTPYMNKILDYLSINEFTDNKLDYIK
jgi:hypothetical protein